MKTAVGDRLNGDGPAGREKESRTDVQPLIGPRTRYTRRRGVIGLAVTLLAVGGVGAYQLAQAWSDTRDVIAVVADVARGELIQASDLTVAAVGPDAALSPVSADRLEAVVGLRAAADLSAGSLLTESAVTDMVIPAAGESVVGVALAPQQLTTEPLVPGDQIRVVSTPAAGDDPPEDNPLEIAATVLGVDHTDTGHVVVNVLVDHTVAGVLAGRVATGRIAVVLDSRERGGVR